ncbi:MAG: Fic family protein [Lewinellaceae bacterium]|nr:Fic family protein [Lewinellaceae bacterium]
MSASSKNLQRVLQQVDARAAELAALQPMKSEHKTRLWEKYRLEWNYSSNHLEGNTLTYQETELLLKFDQLPTEPHTLREVEEMKAHDVVVALVRQWATDPARELSEADVRALNETILVRPFWKDALTPDGQPTRRLISIGMYKEHPNSVRLPNGEVFHYTAPGDVPREMGELIDWYRTEGRRLHPAVAAALLHYRFVCIHPFDDGNGRISRLLLNYHLLRNDLPPVVIKTEDKRNYLFALQKADAGDREAFCVYVAEQLLWSLELAVKAAKGESVEEMGDWEKKIQLLEKSSPLNKGVAEISNDIVYQRLSDSVLPLIIYGSDKLSLINRLFARVERRLTYHFSVQSYPTPPVDPHEAIKMFYEEKMLHAVQDIHWNISWRGLLSNPDQKNNIGTSLTFRFEQFLYKIEFLGSNKPLLSKNYSSAITAHEQDMIVDQIGKYVADRVTANLAQQ